MSRLIFTSFFVLLVQILIGQRLDVIWQQKLDNTELKELIQLPDGKIVGVGSREERAVGKQGLFFEMDPLNGELVRGESLFGQSKDDCINDVIELADGTYYLVGSRIQNGKRDKDAWFLHLAEDGTTILNQSLLSDSNDDEFYYIAQTNDGETIIAGKNSKLSEGNIAIARVTDNVVKWDDEPLGGGAFGTIKGMEQNDDGVIWLFGDTRKARGVDPNDIWMLGLDPSGYFTNNTAIYHGYEFEEFVYQAFPTYNGGFVAIGQTKSSGMPDSDAYIVEIGPEGNIVADPSLVLEGENRFVGIYKYPWGDYYFGVVETLPCEFCPKVFKYDFVLWNKKEGYFKSYNLPVPSNGGPFQVVRMFKANDDSFVIAGISDLGSKRPDSWVLNVKFTDVVDGPIQKGNGSKFDVLSLERLVNCTRNPYIANSSVENLLTPGSRGPLTFELTNVSGSALGDGLATISAAGSSGGIQFKRYEEYIPYLAPNQTISVSFPVIADPNIQKGNYSFDIAIEYNGRRVLSIPANIEVGNIDQFVDRNQTEVIIEKRSSSLIVERPRSATNGRQLNTTANEVEVEVSIISENPNLKAGDIKIYKNSRIVDDTKSVDRFLSQPLFQKDFYSYDFTFTLPLDDAENEIYAVLEDMETGVLSESVKILVNRTYRKPNLFFLGIAPNYTDIQYPKNDVDSMEMLIKEQKLHSNIYGEVVTKKLVDPYETTASEIRKTFEALPTKGIDGVTFDGDNDVLIVFYSGHGIVTPEGREEKFRLVGSDYDKDLINSTTVDFRDQVQYYLEQIDGISLVLLDACRSGSAKAEVDFELSKVLNRLLDSKKGIVTISSCSGDELSYEDDAWENGAFTEALIEGLSYGESILENGTQIFIDENENGFVSIAELYRFLRLKVPDLVKTEKNGASQNPYIPKEQLDQSLEFFRLLNRER